MSFGKAPREFLESLMPSGSRTDPLGLEAEGDHFKTRLRTPSPEGAAKSGIPKSQLGGDIDSAQCDDIQEQSLKDTTRSKIRNSAFYYLSRREYARKELFVQLQKKYSDDRTINQVLDELVEQGLQSDTRFAEAFVRYRSGRGKGPMIIRQELTTKGVDREIIALELEAYDWHQIAKQTYRRKYGDTNVDSPREKAKRMRFMYSRGFNTSDVQSLF